MVNGLRIRNGMTSDKLPPGISWTFKFEPSVAIQAAGIRQFAHGIEDMRVPLTKAVKQVMQPSIRRNFNVGGRPAWEPLSEDTIKAKRGDARILIDSGNLLFVASMFAIWTITDNSATVRDLPSMVRYGKVHQKGAKKAGSGSNGTNGRGYVNIPARPFIMVQPEDEEKIREIFARWLGRQAKVSIK
jgi:phage virion morphogenesis protein